MDDLEAFRRETRAWLEQNCPESQRAGRDTSELVWGGRQVSFANEDQRLWFERMRDRGWFAPDWPREYGGGGLDAQQTAVLEEEMRRLRCRPPQINLGIWMLGPVVLEFGTEEQKRELLPPMARGEVRWCQGFSEPNAGSDLAGLRMSARAEGEDFVLNGSKIWTSEGDKSDWMYALVRTDPSAPRHDGISLIVLDMQSPGITVRPIRLISGASRFCQEFFDDVRVPRRYVIGPLNGGWTVAKRLLQHERSAMSKMGDLNVQPHHDLLEVLRHYLPEGSAPGGHALRARAVDCAMDEHAFRLTLQRMAEQGRAGGDVSGLAAIAKLVHTEFDKRKFNLITEVMGQRALGWEGDEFSPDELASTRAWLYSYATTIAGGTSEVQLNIIAKRVLGLPSH